jgi:hypothetical protein
VTEKPAAMCKLAIMKRLFQGNENETGMRSRTCMLDARKKAQPRLPVEVRIV